MMHACAKGALFVALTMPASASAADTKTPFTDVTNGGLHGGLMTIRGGDRDANAEFFGLDSSHIGFGFEKPFTVRVINTGRLGFGAKGLDGGLGNELSGGLAWHGFLARLGLDGTFYGNKYLWDSRLEIPQIQVGWQHLVIGTVADFAWKGGFILWGRHNTGDGDHLNLDQRFESGGVATVHLWPVDLRASYSHVFVKGENRDVDVLEGQFCGRPQVIQICTDLRYEYADTRRPEGIEGVRIGYVGITIGIQQKPRGKYETVTK